MLLPNALPSAVFKFSDGDVSPMTRHTRARSDQFETLHGLKTLAPNVPVVSYSRDKTAAGLLIRKNRENLLRYSEDLDNTTAWVPGVGSTVADSVKVEGLNRVRSLENRLSRMDNLVTGIENNKYYTLSFSVLSGNTNFCRILWMDSGARKVFRAFMNITDGTFDILTPGELFTDVSVRKERDGSGWRVSVTALMSGVTDASLIAAIGPTNDMINSGATVGSYIYAGRVQLEQSNSATDYIRTTNTAIVSPGIVVDDLGVGDFDPNNFTLIQKVLLTSDPEDATNTIGVNLYCDTANRTRFVRQSSDGKAVLYYNGQGVTSNSGRFVIGKQNAFGLTIAGGRAYISINGGNVVSHQLSKTLIGNPLLHIGGYTPTINDCASQLVQSVALYKSPFTGDELAKVTALYT